VAISLKRRIFSGWLHFGGQALRECCSRGSAAISCVVLLALASVFPTPDSIAQKPAKEVRRVLILNIFEPLASPGVAALDQGIVTGLDKSPYQIELYSEDLEAALFPDEASRRQIRELYVRKYRDRKPDIIIAVGPEPLRFLAESHEKSFPGVPVIFCGSTEEMLGQLKLDSSFTGVWGVAQPEETLNAALRLRPSTKHVVVVGGVGIYDRMLESIARQSLKNFESKLDFTYLTDLAMPALLERLKHLPPHTIVYHTAITEDAAGSYFIDATQSVPMIASAANAPVFVVDDVDVRGGTVGGDVESYGAEGRTAADMAVRVLNGEKPENIPIAKSASVYTFDWRALQRWGLKESDLPPGSIVLHREPTVWESYKWYIVGGLSLVLLEALLIVGLLWERARRRSTETELADTNDSLNKLSGRLIDAQEEERSHVAREIHDDYQQRVAVLAIEIAELAENIGNLNGEATGRLYKLWNYATELGVDLHSLSHRLHSSTLESLGLVAGIETFCEEFSNQQEVKVKFDHKNIPSQVPGDAALCLFRIVQESLRNMKRHSGANEAEVLLEGVGENLHLSVSDRGKGFDPGARSRESGIGLRSMEERLRALGGHLQIGSRPMGGTKIDAWLPMESPVSV
jgi:signal transduction histidine kinase